MAVSLEVGLCGVLIAAAALACTPLLDSPDADFEQGAVGAPLRYPPAAYLKAAAPDAEAWFGYSLAWGGNTLAVTAPRESMVKEDGREITRGGAVYLFEPDGVGWKQTRLVTSNVDTWDGSVDEAYDRDPDLFSGLHVVLDERQLIVAAAGEDSGKPDDPSDNSVHQSGALYVYDRGQLAQESYVKSPEIGKDDKFGYAMALSDEWFFAGCPDQDGNVTRDGTVSVVNTGILHAYRRSGNDLKHAQALTSTDPGYDYGFGSAVAFDGEVLVVASPLKDLHAEDGSLVTSVGSVEVFRLLGGTWVPDAYIPAPAATDFGGFGNSVSVSGNAFAVGASGVSSCSDAASGTAGRGVVYVYREHAGSWEKEACLEPEGELGPALFGYDVSLRDNQLLVGAPWESSKPVAPGINSDNTGSAYWFERSEAGTWTRRAHMTASSAEPADFFGTSVAFIPGHIAVGAIGEAGGEAGASADPGDNGAPGSGAVYLFTSELTR